MHESNHVAKKENYFIGGFVGDSHNDETFKAKMKKLCEKLRTRYGLANFSYCWSPLHIKESIQRTPAQRYHTAVRKSENKTNKRIHEIKRSNLLFSELYIQEEVEKLDQRKNVLKKRYQQ
jgi:hypothetical protein